MCIIISNLASTIYEALKLTIQPGLSRSWGVTKSPFRSSNAASGSQCLRHMQRVTLDISRDYGKDAVFCS
jgi:hypothetical protein